MDIKELLESDEGKAAIATAVEEATKGLVSKRDELLGDNKSLKQRLHDAETKNKEVEEAKRKAEEDAALKSGDVEKIKESLKATHDKEKEALSGELQDTKSKLNKLAIDNGLTTALTEANVAPQLLKAAKALILTEHKPEIHDNDGEVIAAIEGKPIKDFIAEWSQGDHGKHFIAAPMNGGGGAKGANSGGKAFGGEKKGDMAGSRKDRIAAINNQFPDLQKGS